MMTSPKLTVILTLFCVIVSGLSAANVQTIKPERRDLVRKTIQPAKAQAFHTADIGVKITGYVKSVPVDIGDQVKKGQILAIIAVPELDAQRKALQAEERELETGVLVAKANLKAVESESNRILELAKNGSVTKKVGDEASNRLAAAQGTPWNGNRPTGRGGGHGCLLPHYCSV